MSQIPVREVLAVLLFLSPFVSLAVERPKAVDNGTPQTTETTAANGASSTGEPHLQPAQPEDPLREKYILGPDDELTVWVLEAEELSTEPVRIGRDGYMNLPLVGRFRAAGLTIEQLEAELTLRLKTYVREPNVAVSITEFRSQPVSVIGAVQDPGVHQLEGHKSLVEVLSLAGGVRDDASHSVKITRDLRWGRIPLSNAKDDSTGRFSVAEVNLEDFLEARNPEHNVLIKPHDVISVPRAEMVYVIGAVHRAGGFVLRERESISVLQALALAGGLARAASAKSSKVLRPRQGDAERTEIAVNLKDILSNKTPDFALQQDDILFIPKSGGKAAALRTAEAIVGVGSGIAIYRGGSR